MSRLDRVFWMTLLRRVPPGRLREAADGHPLASHRLPILWRWKSKPGRPAVEPELGKMIRTIERVVDEYVDFYNHARPSHGIGKSLDRDGPANSNVGPAALERVTALPVLGGLHHDYRRAA